MPVAEMDKKEALLAMMHWTAETQVEYMPSGKRPGTASYIRYEGYSKAKTVGEALALGSRSEDLLNYFRKFIMKVTGGVLREKPLDASEIIEASTETDKALIRFAKSLNRDLGPASGSGENKATDETTESAVLAPTRSKKPKKGAIPSKALKFSLLKRLQQHQQQQPAKEAAGGQQKKKLATDATAKATNRPLGRLASAKICQGGLLARVMANHSRKISAASSPSKNVAGVASTLKLDNVIQGGLLARVMAKHGTVKKPEGEESFKDVAKKGAKLSKPPTFFKTLDVKLAHDDEAGSAKRPTDTADSQATTATPPKKRKVGHTDDTVGGLTLALSTKKEPAGPHEQQQFPDKSLEVAKVETSHVELSGCSHLLALVNVLSLAEIDPAAAVSLLAGYFQRIAQATERSEEIISAAVRLLEPVAPASPEALEAAITEAFGAQATDGVIDPEGLVMAAAEGRKRVVADAGAVIGKRPRLLVEDAAQAVWDKEHQPAQLGKLLMASRVEAGETRWLVRLLQGRSGLARGTVNSALARALVSSMQ